MSVKTSNNLQEFIEYFKANSDYIPFSEKSLFEGFLQDVAMLEPGREVDGFQFKLMDGCDHGSTMLSVKWGRGNDLVCKAVHLHPSETYRVLKHQDAVDKLEELLDNGKLHDFHPKLVPCVNALLGVVDDGFMAELCISISEQHDRLTGLYAAAFNDLIVIEH
jgi:hypothetical protein